MKKTDKKTLKRTTRHKRIRAKVFGTVTRPRLAVFKSNCFITAAIINDETGSTLLSAHSKNVQGTTGMERAENTGKAIAELAKEKKITQVVFDRGGFEYTGVIKALAEGARAGGLIF